MKDDKRLYGKYTEQEVIDYLNKNYAENSRIGLVNKQTKGFFKLLFDNMEAEIINLMEKGCSVLDWGCGAGIGTHMLTEKFQNSTSTGLDICSVAIDSATKEFPKSTFITGKIQKTYDIIITSNCLEHFVDYESIYKNLLTHTNKYLVILVPYKGRITNKISDHMATLDENSFKTIVNDFKIINKLRVHGGKYDMCWNNYQLLVTYKKKIKTDNAIRVHCGKILS